MPSPDTTHPRSNDVTITLTADEALVLFEFVRRFSDTDELVIKNAAEQQALWNLCCLFEKASLGPPEALHAAHARLGSAQ